MQADHQVLERHLKRTTIVSNAISMIIALCTAFGVTYGFYYETKTTLDQHGKEIKDVQTEVSKVNQKINENDVFKGVSSEKFNEFEKRVDKMDEKLDKILTEINRR